jgi:hypothetical protein
MGIRRTSDSGRAASLPTLAVDRSRDEPKEIVMNPIRHIRRVAGVLPAQAHELVMSRIPRIRRRPGDLAAPAGVVRAAGVAAPAALAHRAVGSA